MGNWVEADLGQRRAEVQVGGIKRAFGWFPGVGCVPGQAQGWVSSQGSSQDGRAQRVRLKTGQWTGEREEWLDKAKALGRTDARHGTSKKKEGVE